MPTDDASQLPPDPISPEPWRHAARVGPVAAVGLLGCVTALLLVLVGWNVWAMHDAYRDLDERGLGVQRELGRIAYIDEALTMSANMAALTGDLAWRRRHAEFERELVRDNLDIERVACTMGLHGDLRIVHTARDSLVAMEHATFDLVARGRRPAAWALLSGPGYARQKASYVGAARGVTAAFESRLTRLQGGYRQRLTWLLVLSGLSLAVLLAGFAVAMRNVIRYVRLEQRTVEQAFRHRASLEERVRERTAVLESTSEQLRQAQKMEAIGQLAGGVAHDFNNLLTTIQGHAELLQDELEPTHPARADVDQIRKATERAATLTSQLLAFGRRQLLKPQIVSLNDIVRSTDRMMRRVLGAHIELVTVLDPELPHCRVDPNQVEHVLINLIVNARDAIGAAGGTITVETRTLADPALAGASRCALVVRDTGVGMSPDVLARIFEPFFTTKAVGKGTGLGLATVYGIVEQSGGEVRAESAPGAGATFIVEFPACAQSPQTGEHPIPGSTVEPSDDTVVLLVEDEPGVRHLLTRTLVTQGYQVLVAQNGEEGRRVFARHEADIDVIVTDVVMPLMSGQEMIRHLRERRPELPVLFMSGYTASAAIDQVAGAHTRFIGKPFGPSELVRALHDLLAEEGVASG